MLASCADGSVLSCVEGKYIVDHRQAETPHYLLIERVIYSVRSLPKMSKVIEENPHFVLIQMDHGILAKANASADRIIIAGKQ